nr:tetratricopeptide-like helical domain-containing protein [Tanacetum cinerariifolium]
MYAMVLFLVVITSTSSTLCVSSNKNNGVPEIYMVVDDQLTTVHDSGRAMSKANPIQIGKFHLEDGKVLTLSRKSSPSRNCVGSLIKFTWYKEPLEDPYDIPSGLTTKDETGTKLLEFSKNELTSKWTVFLE